MWPFKQLFDWAARQLGTNKPHLHYYSPMNGYVIRRVLHVVAEPSLAVPTQRAMIEWQNALNRAGIDLQLIWSGAPVHVMVVWDTNGHVEKGNTGHTMTFGGDGKTRDRSATPFFITGGTIYVKDGTSGKELERLLKHEMGHILGLQHSEEPLDLGYPLKSGADKASAADVETLRLTYTRKDRPREQHLI